MNKAVNQVLVALGIVLLILFVIFTYLVMTNTYGLNDMIFGTSAPAEAGNNEDASNGTNGDRGFTLSGEQKQALGNMGIDPATVPTSVSAEQEGCFISVLGEARVTEIRNGAVPSAVEFAKARACI